MDRGIMMELSSAGNSSEELYQMDLQQHYRHQQELMQENGIANHLRRGPRKTLKHQKHIYTERQRRIYMSTLLESLQALLPNPRPRKDRCTLLTEVIDYVGSLEETIKVLSKRKEEILVSSTQRSLNNIQENDKNASYRPCCYPTNVGWRSNLSLTNLHVQAMDEDQEISEIEIPTNTKDIIITFLSSYMRGLWSEILFCLQQHEIDVINVTFSTISPTQKLHYIHARIPRERNIQNDDMKVIFSNLLQP